MNTKELLKQLTVEEKAALLAGRDFMYTNAVPRLNIAAVEMSDGPSGLRKQKAGGDNGIKESEKATCFPAPCELACGWREENAYALGQAIAKECKHYGVGVLLAPAANIKRNPRAGRNFEYFSEDPLLSGKTAAAYCRGVQSEGVGVSLKHFALNNAENHRFTGDSVADDRAVREIYLKSFEIAVKEGRPASVMCAYNRVNGTFASENEWLLGGVLRGEWGFDGLVMTDWGATHDRVAGVKAGCDLEMPGDTPYCRERILSALADGALPQERLDAAVENVLNFVDRYAEVQREEADFTAHDELALRIAEDCAVLLKNDGSLPFRKEEKLLVVGDLFEKMRYQGAGSSMVNPLRTVSPAQAFSARGANYEFARGYFQRESVPRGELIEEALVKAKNCDKIAVFAGLSDEAESEGADRETLSLPENQLALLRELGKTNKPIVVVLFGGSTFELPFAERANAILDLFLAGQRCGEAAANLLFGDLSPSGRLAESWVISQSDVPFDRQFSKSLREVYKESVFVGYRYYVTANKKVLFPFGHGLSYTKFDYSDLHIAHADGMIAVTCTVTNAGNRAGAEVVQLYSTALESKVFRPKRELRAFTKIDLAAGESKKVMLSFSESELAYYNVGMHRFVGECGEYEIEICRDAESPLWAGSVQIGGEKVASPYSDNVQNVYSCVRLAEVTDGLFEEMSGSEISPLPPILPITTESRFTDLRRTFFGKILYSAVLGMARRKARRARCMREGTEKENALKGALFLRRVLESGCLRSMSMSAGKRMPYHIAEGMAELANGKIFSALGKFFKKNKAPPLPAAGRKKIKNKKPKKNL